MMNQHLLNRSMSVAEYEACVAREQGMGWLTFMPPYVIARCPYCEAENVEQLDTYTPRYWRVTSAGAAIGRVVGHCQHLALAQSFVNFEGAQPAYLRGRYPPEVPFVMGHLLERRTCQAVVHALPICEIESAAFVPRYTLYLVTYFSAAGSATVRELAVSFNARYVGEGIASSLLEHAPADCPEWRDLGRWVAAGQLWWLDAGTPSLALRSGDAAAFPYQPIHGRTQEHRFPRPYDGEIV